MKPGAPSRHYYGSRSVIMLRIAPIVVELMALSSQAFAGGPIYTHRYELPPAIARLHTCIGPRQRTLRYPDPWRVGKRRMFRIGCPENARDITRLPHRDESGHVRKPDDDPDQFKVPSTISPTTRAAAMQSGLCCPIRSDGTKMMTDAFDEELDVGWRARAHQPCRRALDLAGAAIYPPGEHDRYADRAGRSARDQERLRHVARQGRQGGADVWRDRGNPAERRAVAPIAALYDCAGRAAGAVKWG